MQGIKGISQPRSSLYTMSNPPLQSVLSTRKVTTRKGPREPLELRVVSLVESNVRLKQGCLNRNT